MKKQEIQNNSLTPENSEESVDFQNSNLEAILDSTNARIWAIDKNYCLIFGNSIYHVECQKEFNRIPNIGDSVLFDDLNEEVKHEWQGYYDRALNGEKFSIERRRKYGKEEKWSIYHFGPLLDKNGKCIGASVVAHDITDRIIATEELKKSTKRFEELIEMLPEAIFEMDTDFRLTYVNQRALDLFGYTHNDITEGLNGLEMLTPEYRDLAKQNFIKRIKGEDPGTVEYKGLNKDGSSFPILFHASSVFEDGKLKGVRGVIIDISKQKHEEEKHRQLVMMLDLAPSSVIVHDFNGNFLYVNQKTFDLYGYEREEFITLSIKGISAPESSKLINERMNLLSENGEAKFDVVHLKKDGTKILLEVYALVTKWYGESAILSIGTDITQRKLDEKALQESEEKFKNIFNNSVVGISVTSIDGELNVNKAFSEIVGYSEGELYNMNWKKITHPEDVEKNQEILESIHSGKTETARWEKRYIHKNGNIIWVDISTTLQRDNKGNPQYFITSIVDITERKQAEEKLIESEERYRNVIDISPDAIIIHCEGKIVLTNKAAIQLVGASKPDDLLGKSALEVVHPDDREMVKIRIMNLLKSGEPAPLYEERMIRFDGSVIYAEVAAVRTNYKGKPASLVVLRDFTERKISENALRESEMKFRSIFDQSPVGSVIVGLDKCFVKCNASFCNFIGYNEEEIIGHTIGEFTHPDDIGIGIKELRQLSNGSIESIRLQKRYVRKDGTTVWGEVSIRIVCDDQQKPLYFLPVIQDITMQKSIEQELIKAKEKAEETEIQLFSILENSPTGFAINSISTGKVKYVNKAFTDAYHIPLELCQTVESFFEYVFKDQMELGNKILDDVKSGDPERMKWEMIPVTDKTTQKVHYISAANIILKDQDLMISSVWDVTSQVENEEKLISALNKATESDRLKSAFLANMSHEIRTPMNGILGFSSLLKEPQLTGEEQKRYIEIIEKSGERMLNTINDIIDISKIESGQMEILISELNIVELFENILSFFKPEADKKGIKLLSSIKITEKETVIKSDREKLIAVLTNLVKNAIKFCDKGSIELGCVRKDNFLEFYVKDTGKGIPPNRMDAIFERFVQADIDDKDVKEGSGLGLSIAKSYVELLGGKIWVESTKDIGSTFFFTIPFTQVMSSENNKSVPGDNVEDNIEKLNILIVEDEQVSELLTRVMIEKVSNKILIAKNGVEAVELCKSNPDLDLILMDMKMPVMNGYKATQNIREFNKDIIIIAITAFALTGDKEKALEAGCNDYLTKPLSQKRLGKLLKLYF